MKSEGRTARLWSEKVVVQGSVVCGQCSVVCGQCSGDAKKVVVRAVVMQNPQLNE